MPPCFSMLSCFPSNDSQNRKNYKQPQKTHFLNLLQLRLYNVQTEQWDLIMPIQIRQLLSALPKKTKERVLKTTMLVLMAISFMTILLVTAGGSGEEGKPYDGYLKRYSQKYWSQQEWYNRFAFYLTHENMIFSDKQLKESYYEQINTFANLTEAQFQELYHITTSLAKSKSFLQIAEFEDNYYYDWADFIPPVKDMKHYDGSHIFAVIAAMEFEANKKAVLAYRQQNITLDLSQSFITLSEQQVIDCCSNCLQHKQPRYVYEHLKEYGVSTSQNYPYISSIYRSEPQTCKTRNEDKPYHLKNYDEVLTCKKLAERLIFGPVVVAVDSRTWGEYDGGIFEGCSSSVKRNHYALVVGRGIGYWKIRNSWGSRWGQHGHIRIKSGNSCGVCGRGSSLEIE